MKKAVNKRVKTKIILTLTILVLVSIGAINSFRFISAGGANPQDTWLYAMGPLFAGFIIFLITGIIHEIRKEREREKL